MQVVDPSSSLAGRQCIHCSYKLDGLSASGVCPECGQPIEDSLKGLLLRFASPAYLREVSTGLSLYLNGILVMIVTSVLAGIAAFALRGSPAAMAGATLLGLVPQVMMLLGFWKYTAPDPGYVGQENPNNPRQIARIALVVSAVATLISASLQFAGYTTGFTIPGAGGTGGAGGAGAVVFSTAMLVGVVVGLVAAVAWIAQFFAGLQYTKWMMSRIPDEELVTRTKKYMWLLPVIYLVGSCLIVGPLIALVMYWNHLDKLRKHLQTLNIPVGQDTFAPPR